MAGKIELMKLAVEEMKKAELPPEKWARQVQKGGVYRGTHNFRALQLLYQAAHAPNPSPPPPPTPDLSDVQRCLFLTSDISHALETRNRLLIATADLGYRKFYTPEFLSTAISQNRFRVWCDCRPAGGENPGTPPRVALEWLDDLKLSHDFFYGQCESMSEWNAARAAGSRRLVGNLSVLDDAALKEVSSGLVHVTNETYFNVDRNYPVNWRNANKGVGSNCMAVYESVREGATYYPLEAQAADGKYNAAVDCVYVAGFLTPDWGYVVAH